MKRFAAIILLLLAATAVFSQAAKPQFEIPFEYVHHQIVVQVTVGGKGPSTCWSTLTPIRRRSTRRPPRVGAGRGNKGGAATGGGTEVNIVYPTRLPSVELGTFVTKDVAAATIDLTKISERMGRKFRACSVLVS
jgi:hypothetical protein